MITVPRPTSRYHNDQDWRTQAECLTAEPELFFPLGATEPAQAQAERAKAICRRCAVMAICKETSLASREAHGVWGGVSEDERRALIRRQLRAERRQRHELDPTARHRRATGGRRASSRRVSDE